MGPKPAVKNSKPQATARPLSPSSNAAVSEYMNELHAKADVKMDPKILLKFYLRTASLMFQQAKVYHEEKDYATAYVLFMKFSSLVITEFPKHPQYKDPSCQSQNCITAMDAIEALKPLLKQAYLEAMKRNLEKKAASAASQSVESGSQPVEKHTNKAIGMASYSSSYATSNYPQYVSQPERRVEATSPIQHSFVPQYPGLSANQSAAIEFSKLSISGTLSPPPIPIKPAATGSSLTNAPVNQLSGINKNAWPTPQFVPDHNIGVQRQPQFTTPITAPPVLPSTPPPPLGFIPPAIPPKRAIISSNTSTPSLNYGGSDVGSGGGGAQGNAGGSPPPVPWKPALASQVLSTADELRASAKTEDGRPLRPLNVPRSIISTFSRIAQSNTSRNIETCAILGGVLRQNSLFITTLVVPKQRGTSDTCTTEDEEGLFDELEKRGIMAFGWVHTHPTQTCFLSSVDLHTHCSYQLMLPEAIAIVISPKHTPDHGVFRLSDPTGLDMIATCDRGFNFHPHPEPTPPDPPIYVSADSNARRNGHVIWVGKATDSGVEVVDLR